MKLPAFVWCLICGFLWNLISSAVPSSAEVQDLKCYSVEGNVNHYYHFFMNCLVPVILYHERNPGKKLRLCSSHIGGMAAIFKDILPNMQFSKDCGKDTVFLKGYDDDYGKGVKRITQGMRLSVLRHFATFRVNMTKPMKLNETAVLLIGRDRPHHPISSPAQGRKLETTGAQRRAIRNFEELDRVLRYKFGSVNTVYLEGLSIRMQYQLFRSAKVIVAQHGAALSNLFFVTNNITKGVVEISPYTRSHRIGKHTHSFPDCFKYICETIDVGYVRVQQEGEFSDVNVENVLNAVTKLLGKS